MQRSKFISEGRPQKKEYYWLDNDLDVPYGYISFNPDNSTVRIAVEDLLSHENCNSQEEAEDIYIKIAKRKLTEAKKAVKTYEDFLGIINASKQKSKRQKKNI